jgi:histidyl-tRNA synthetase
LNHKKGVSSYQLEREAAGGPSPESERLSLIRRFMNELPEIGSVCSGGRYGDLVGLYSKEKLSGVGSSIGLNRLIAALEALGMGVYARAVIACVNEELGGAYQAPAEKKGAEFVIIPGEAPLAGTLTLREISGRRNRENLNFEEVLNLIKQ